MFKIKGILLLLLTIVLTILLVLISSLTNGILILTGLPETINKQILYHLITIFITIIFLLVL